MIKRVCLVHYHEIGLKGKNRSKFENMLVRNIKASFGGPEQSRVNRISGHILVRVDDDADIQKIAQKVAQVPGVAKVSLAYKCAQDPEEYCECAKRALHAAEPFESFKVHARRSNTNYPLHSIDLNREVGSVLCAEFPEKKVQMHHPDVEVHVHMVQNDVYVFASGIQGAGGLPVGSAGKVVTLLSSGFDSPVSTWMVGRRGAVCVPVHFSGRPVVADTSEYLCQDIVEALKPAGMIGRLYVVPIGEYQRQIALVAPQGLRIIMYRRLMYAVAERIAQIEGAKALVTGESLGQVASQTLENITATSDVVTTMPILRPLIGSDKTEIIERAHKIGTYDICCQPAPDCCTVFMPRRPETKANLNKVREAWDTFDHEAMIEEILSQIEYIDFDGCPAYKPPKAIWRHHHFLGPIEPQEQENLTD